MQALGYFKPDAFDDFFLYLTLSHENIEEKYIFITAQG